MKTKRMFGELEGAILRLFQHDERLTVKEVHFRLGGIDKYNTIMTVMVRLADKGKLRRERIGLQYFYWLVSSAQSTLFQLIQRKLFGLKPAEVVCCLLEEPEQISDSELEQMEKALAEARQRKGRM